MEFILIFLLSIFGAQEYSPGNTKNLKQLPNSHVKQTIRVDNHFNADRPDPDKQHGPIIIIDDTQYHPIQE